MSDDSGCAPSIFEDSYTPTRLLSLACCKGGQVTNEKDINTGLRYWVVKEFFDALCDNEIYFVYIYKVGIKHR